MKLLKRQVRRSWKGNPDCRRWMTSRKERHSGGFYPWEAVERVSGSQVCSATYWSCQLWLWQRLSEFSSPVKHRIWPTPGPALLTLCSSWGSPDVMIMKILAQGLAPGWETLTTVLKHVRRGSQVKEEEEHVGGFWGCCVLGKSPLEVGAQGTKQSVLINIRNRSLRPVACIP